MPPYTAAGRSRFLRNYSKSVPGYTISKLRREYFPYSPQ